MNREEITHYSRHLDRGMHIMIYGQGGIPFLSFPTQDSMCHNYVSCSVVHIRVESQTGNSTWNCRIDFNDHGKISGKYVISSDNDQSSIPEHVADKIADEIRKMTIEELYG